LEGKLLKKSPENAPQRFSGFFAGFFCGKTLFPGGLSRAIFHMEEENKIGL
jgi:hypothetical protein